MSEKRRCPANGIECCEVRERTVLHQARHPWLLGRRERYFHCADPDCEVVYFGEDGTVVTKSEVRAGSEEDLICHCFNVTLKDAIDDPGLRDFVAEQTRAGLCACETRNPSGRCCLKDFP